MAKKYDSIQEKSQALSDAADQISADSQDTSSENAAVSATLVTDDSATGTSASVSTVKETNTTTVSDAYSTESDTVKLIISHLEDYVLKADPSKVQTSSSILDLQKMFVRTVEQLVNLSSTADFALCFKRLLVLAKKYEDGAFAPNMRFRRISSLPKGDAYLNAYISFIDMVCAFADPATRRTLIMRYNVGKHAMFAKPEYRERIVQFVREISGV